MNELVELAKVVGKGSAAEVALQNGLGGSLRKGCLPPQNPEGSHGRRAPDCRLRSVLRRKQLPSSVRHRCQPCRSLTCLRK